jgi:hypothetical protein
MSFDRPLGQRTLDPSAAAVVCSPIGLADQRPCAADAPRKRMVLAMCAGKKAPRITASDRGLRRTQAQGRTLLSPVPQRRSLEKNGGCGSCGYRFCSGCCGPSGSAAQAALPGETRPPMRTTLSTPHLNFGPQMSLRIM